MTDMETLRRLERAERTLDRLKTRDVNGGSGTAFPTGISAGFEFFRTDLGFACYYDGTRWLTVHEYAADFTHFSNVTQPYTGGANTLLIFPPRVDHSIYVTYARAFVFVSTTNNGSNYWSMALSADGVAVWSFDTSANAPGANIYKVNATVNTVTGPNLFTYDVTGKTGAPGSLLLNATFWYRLVIT